ncbi:MAG: saccharopine dehydrogenase C-terminal domain-containing protein, partial [Thermoplasmata archaeon]
MITVVGAGNIGSAIVDFLLEKDNISVIDISEKSLKKLTNVKKYKGTVMDNKQVIEKSDFVINALPGSISFEIISKIIKMGKGVIDVSYMPEDPFLLNDIAMEKNVFFVPDAGFAPGLSNIAAGFLYKSLISPKKIEIYVAGLPMIKVPPLDYTITWSIEGLIDEYTRPARMIKNYKIVSVDPLETVEPFCISNLGSYESFVSDGLRTLLKTIKIRDMFERTLRYPSHIDKIKMLRDLGYFSKEKIGNCSP